MADNQHPVLRIRETLPAELQKLAASGNLYAVIDACAVPAAPTKVLEVGDTRAASLFRGTAEEQFWEVAPYLLAVDETLMSWLGGVVKEGWGIFIASKAGLESLRRHLRHFLRVQAPTGEIWYFRLYDPRVLKPFLIASTKSELRTVFGPVLAYGVTDATSRGAVFFQEEISKARPDQPTEPTHSFMFRLRGEHLEAFRPQLEADFIKRLARHLRSEHAGVVDCPDQKLSERVLFGLERARRYQMRRESNLATFVALMFEFAPAFDEHPHVKQILTSADVAPEDRMNVLVEEVTEDDWEAIKQSKKLSAWDE